MFENVFATAIFFAQPTTQPQPKSTTRLPFTFLNDYEICVKSSPNLTTVIYCVKSLVKLVSYMSQLQLHVFLSV